MTNDWPLVGRDDELARLRTTLLGRVGGGVVVAGPPGAGKTSLARHSVALASELGLTGQWVYGTKATAATPLGAFAPVLPDLADAPSRDRLLYEAHRVLRGPEGNPPALLAIDDAHLLDDMSALLVYQLATAGATVVVLTIRSGQAAPGPIVDLWKDAHVERIELGPLDPANVEEILTTLLGGPVDMALTHQLWRASGGNPLYIRELFQAAWDKGLIREEAGTWRLTGELPSSPRLAELVEARLGGLDEEARAALELLAVGEPLRLAHVEGLISFDVLSRLETDGLLRVMVADRGDVIQLGHPLYGEVLRSGVPPLRVRHLHQTLADSLEASRPTSDADRDQVTRWRMASGDHVDTADLLGVARRALAIFDVDFAVRCATQAYHQEPSARCATVLGRALVLAKDHHEAEALFAVVEDLTATDEETVEWAQARADNLFHWLDRPEAAQDVTIRAEGKVASEESQRRLAFHRAWFELFDGQPLSALAVAEANVAHPDPKVRLDTAVLGARACMLSGRFSDGLEFAGRITAAQRLDPRTTTLEPGLRLTTEVFIFIESGRLEEAATKARAAHARAMETGHAGARGWFADLLGRALLLQGQVATAERWFREAVVATSMFGIDPWARSASAEMAYTLALRGDARGAAAALDDLEAFRGRRWRLFEAGVARARAWTAVADGDVASALTLLTEAAEAQRRGKAHVFEASLLHDLVRLGGASPSVAERLEELSGLVDGELTATRARQARAIVDGDRDGLIEAGRCYERMGALLFAAEAGFAAADLASRGRADRDASAAARIAHDLLARCQGARIPGLAASKAAPVVSAREREIATLAGQGWSSKAIAERLFLSARTVDNYLGRLFAKLGVTSRAELPDALAGVPPAES
jgi:DNA-binding CsgD family transcriptional regulator